MVQYFFDAAKEMVVVATLVLKQGMLVLRYWYLRGYFLVMNLIVGLMDFRMMVCDGTACIVEGMECALNLQKQKQ
jgi:hypothetical protein